MGEPSGAKPGAMVIDENEAGAKCGARANTPYSLRDSDPESLVLILDIYVDKTVSACN
jgi:hypothetical protein